MPKIIVVPTATPNPINPAHPPNFGPVPPGSPSTPITLTAASLSLHEDPDLREAQDTLDRIKAQHDLATLRFQEAKTNRDAWLAIEQTNREIVRASKQEHYDQHADHHINEFEAAQDKELTISRNQAMEQGQLIQIELEEAQAALHQIKIQLNDATREYKALLKAKLTGHHEEDINNSLNPFAGFGPWGKTYGWYLLAFLIFAALVLIFIH
jgi:hypothetical protein